MATLDALPLAGSGVALDFHAVRVLAGATLAFCSACSFADLTLDLPCRFKIHQDSSSDTCLGMGIWQLPCPTSSIDSPERKQLAAVRLWLTLAH